MLPRRLFNVARVVSLILFLAVAGLWPRSYWGFDLGVLRVGRWVIGVGSPKGAVLLWYQAFPSSSAASVLHGAQFRLAWTSLQRLPDRQDLDWQFAGFGVDRGELDLPVGRVLAGALVFPSWFLLLLTGVLPARWCFFARGRWRREKWRKLGLCEHCGYDLRATPDRCPECGMERE